MLNRNIPLKRVPFKRTTMAYVPEDPEARAEARQQRMANLRLTRLCPQVAISDIVIAVPKDNLLQSETYRRLVASMPCAWCGVVGYSQHAHENRGKGMGLKVDDRRAFPLCCARPDVEGCHAAFDQYRLIEGGREAHVALGNKWARETRKHVVDAGLWPKKLPRWTDG